MDLVENRNNQPVTTSLQVAETFEKNHRDVLKSIDEMLNSSAAQNFATDFVRGTYKNSQNHEYPMYYMNKDGFTLLAMGFTGKKAMKFKLAYIDQFNKMDSIIKQGNLDSYAIEDPVMRANKWIEEEKRRKQLALENEEMKPKALFADAVTSSKSTILIGDLSKLLNQNGIKIGRNRMFKWLRDNGYLIKAKGKSYNTPTQRSMNLKLFSVTETVIQHGGDTIVSQTTRVTGKGQKYFVNKFLKLEKQQ